VNLYSSVSESYTYKLQHSLFGAANCRLPSVPHFLLIWGAYCYALLLSSMNADVRYEFLS